MGRPGAGMPMMGGEMGQMMEMMQRMMGGMPGAGGMRMSPMGDEGSQMGRMGEMMQSMGQMMGTMGRMMSGRAMGIMEGPSPAAAEQRLAALKSRLSITDAQTPQWNAFADALQSGEQKVRSAFAEARQAPTSLSAPDRAELRV